jgi:hypothetical protein
MMALTASKYTSAGRPARANTPGSNVATTE